MAERRRAALVVVAADDEARATLTAELQRRYGRDYTIVGSVDPDDVVGRLAGSELPVAALFGCFGVADPDGLARVRELHRQHQGAMAVAVVRWGHFEAARPIFEAITRGQLDRGLYVPEVGGDEEFHRAVTEIFEMNHGRCGSAGRRWRGRGRRCPR